MLISVAGLLWVGSRAGICDTGLVADTVVWFIATGLLMFGRSIDLFRSEGSFRRLVLEVLSVTALVEGFLNLYVLPLGWEFALFPVIFFLTGVLAVAEARHEDDAAAVSGGMLSAVALILCTYVAARVAADFHEFIQGGGPRELLMPIWLTLGMLPFIALLGLYAPYDSAFRHIGWVTENPRARWRGRLALVSGLRMRAREVSAFNAPWAKRLTSVSSFAEARAVIRRFREEGPPDGPILAPS
jgi:hypothetical protein